MRFTNDTTCSLSSLSERIDHGNVAAAGGIAMSANAPRTARNMSVDAVSANLAGSEHPQHATYLHALQQYYYLNQCHVSWCLGVFVVVVLHFLLFLALFHCLESMQGWQQG